MISTSYDIQIVCTIDGDRDLMFIRLDLCNDGKHITTLEYSDITNEFLQLLEINSQVNIFNSEDGLKAAIANAQLLKFLGEKRDDSKLDLLLNIRMKVNHQQGVCKDNCILCNPDLGDDPFPDFAFDAKFSEPKGEA